MPASGNPSHRSAARTKKPVRRAARPSRPVRVDPLPVCEVLVIDQHKVSKARAALPKRTVLVDFAERLRALGDPTRLQIVCALAAEGVGELCVCDLATLTAVSDSAVSHSLRTLRHLGIVEYRKVGRIAYYSMDDPRVAALARDVMRAGASR